MSPAEPDASRMGHLSIGGPIAVAAMTLGMLTWPIAFNLGVHGVVFYDDVFRVVVASSILFVITLFHPPYPQPWLAVVWLALAAPLAWLLAAGFIVGSTGEAMERPEFAVALIVVALVSLPVTFRLLTDLFLPDLSQAAGRRVIAGIVGLVAVVGVIGFAVGREHSRFLTCDDFAVAGAAEPSDCTP